MFLTLFSLRPLQKRVESRKRGLQFYIPAIVAIGQHCRLVESNSSIISLQDIYERHCAEAGMDKDDPIMAFTEKLKDIISVSRHVSIFTDNSTQSADDTIQQPGFVTAAAKLEAYMEIACKIFPDTIVRDVSHFWNQAGLATPLTPLAFLVLPPLDFIRQ